jgi:hypothetical protein
MEVCAFGSELAEHDWRKEIIDYLESPSRKVSRKLRCKAIKFVLLDGNLFLQIIGWSVVAMLGSKRSKENEE